VIKVLGKKKKTALVKDYYQTYSKDGDHRIYTRLHWKIERPIIQASEGENKHAVRAFFGSGTQST